MGLGCQRFGGRTRTEETGRANVTTAIQRPMQSEKGQKRNERGGAGGGRNKK